MPILPPETEIFPSDLLEDSFVCGDDAAWKVVYTKPRQEKSLARDLVTRQIPFYLPLVPKLNRIRGKTVRSFSPLFSGYVFIRVPEEVRREVLQTNRALRMVNVADEAQLIGELQNLRRLIAADAPLTIERKLEAGRAVRVKSGPLAGTEGIVLTRRGKHCLVVAVTLLQQGVSVEIDDYRLEPIY